MKGRITKSTGSWYEVETDEGVYKARIRGKLRLKGIKSTNPIAAGDFVEMELQAKEKGLAVITKLYERKNYIIRKSVNLSKQTQIIAANLDQAILIATLDFPKTYQRFIDRFAVTAEAYDVPFVLVFNKTDLYSSEMLQELEYLTLMYKDAGYRVLSTSAVAGNNMSLLKDLLKDKITLLSGHSGVGKSTLINKIEPGLDLKTNKISDSHLQGQHTTTFAEMFKLSFGGDIIDTPGIRGFGLVDMEKEEIGDYFPEIFRIKERCKFHNCLHLHEPGCAVKEAVENGDLALPRYESYISFVEGTDDDEIYRKDIHHQ